jgi:beta-glucosidase
VVDPGYRDASLPVEQRIELLLDQMTVPEKAGLFFHTMIGMGPGGELAEANPAFGMLSTHELVVDRHLTHFNLFGALTDPAEVAEWHNRMQELAASTRLGVPITLSTDPRHSFTDNPGAAFNAGAFSEWPESLGLAAIGDEALVETFADMARQEYLAVGLRVALHPQIDLATEPRWARQVNTFGEDADLSGRLGAAYIRGFQGPELGPRSVATMVKHFPGGGPQLDGEDPHFSYGREQVYPGGQFDLHLQPFEVVLAAAPNQRPSQMMPYYGMPIGTEYEEVGFGFNAGVITGLLRERLGFDGIVCTDWGLLLDREIMGEAHVARAWGVEHLTPPQRLAKALDAGVDQFGGESAPDLLVELVSSGEVSEQRLDVSARRLLREKFRLGLFDERYVDASRARTIVGQAGFRAAGEAAQRAALTLLTNPRDVLPLRRGCTLYVEGIDPVVAAEYAEVSDDPRAAEVAVVRLKAPYEQRATKFENFFHAGSLDFDPAVVDRLNTLAEQVPLIVDVFCDRPAILTPVVEISSAVVVNFGANPRALLDMLFGVAKPQGRLPFDLPSSMAAVRANRPDVPFDTEDPLFRFGHGLAYDTTSGVRQDAGPLEPAG